MFHAKGMNISPISHIVGGTSRRVYGMGDPFLYQVLREITTTETAACKNIWGSPITQKEEM